MQLESPRVLGRPTSANQTGQPPWRWPAGLRQTLPMVTVLFALIASFGLLTDHFLSARAFFAMAQQVPVLLIAAVGATFVMMLGQIDLSVGSALALCGSVLGASLVGGGVALPLAIAAAIFTGVALGAVNGLVMVQWRVPSFIVTLGMLEVARGGTYLITNSRTQYIGSTIEPIAEANVFGVSLAFVFALAIVGVGDFVMTRTVFGRYIVAAGTNEEAVRLCGINTKRIRVLAFMVAGGLAGLAAVVHTSRLAAADPNAGVGFELQAIAAVVIGGTSLMGGRGSSLGTLFGVLIITVLDAGLAQMGAPEPAKRLVTGFVIVAAVILDKLRHRGLRAG